MAVDFVLFIAKFFAIFESGKHTLSISVRWSVAKNDILCSATNDAILISALDHLQL